MAFPHPSIARRRNRRYVILVLLVLLVIGGWIAFWFYAQGAAREAIAGWKAREARAGRVYDCGSQSIGGFPFRFELLCDSASAVIRSAHPPATVTAPNVHLAAQVYDPTLLIAEVAGPLTYAEEGRPPRYSASWSLAQASVRGTPRAPERVSVVLEQPSVKRLDPAEPVLDAERLEIHGRMLEGSAQSHPVIELVLRSAKLSAPVAGPMAVKPVDGEVDAVLRGLNDFAPKPWPARFRELAQSGGRIEIRRVRVQQGDTLAVGAGALTVNGNGRLDGQLTMTIAGAESLINDVLAANRRKLGFSVSLGLGLLGGSKRLEGRPAISLPLRVADGTMYLGPVKLAEVPPLF
jgi:hypothetical protein